MKNLEQKIKRHLDKAGGYSGKAHDELQMALNIALEGKGLSKEEKSLLSVDFTTGTEEAVERVRDGLNDNISPYDSDIRDKSVLDIYKMTGEQIREFYDL